MNSANNVREANRDNSFVTVQYGCFFGVLPMGSSPFQLGHAQRICWEAINKKPWMNKEEQSIVSNLAGAEPGEACNFCKFYCLHKTSHY